MSHRTVLLNEAVDALAIKPEGLYIDGTFGRGGHSRLILQKLGENGRLIAIDKDPEAIAYAEKEFADDKRFSIVHASFADMADIAEKYHLIGSVDGVLMDLGVSSPQLDDASRGFSFQRDGKLDMRMDDSSGMSAAEWLLRVEEKELVDILFKYGEEKFARRIARAILERQKQEPMTTTLQLAKLVADVVPGREKNKNPATRTFQAIRIAINNELGDLEDVLPQMTQLLAHKGRLVVISFHSLEDRMVKRFMRDQSKPGRGLPAKLALTADQLKTDFRLVGKAIKASAEEVKENTRSRSAVMRICERC